jgi:hypothetical protein
VLKLKKSRSFWSKITPAVNFAGLVVLMLICLSVKMHPYYISVVDIKYTNSQNTLQISSKMFINDLEDALKKTSKKNIDILNPKNKTETDSVLFNYIKQRLSLNINSKPQLLNYVGYEKEEDAIWTYLEIKNCKAPKKINIETKLLYDFLPTETIIIHCEINGVKKSSKITNPDSNVEFSF